MLLCWRGSDPSPPLPFTEAYFCITCDEYFSLVYARGAQPLAPNISVLSTRKGLPRPTPVQCPKCGDAYPDYGMVDTAVSPQQVMGRELLIIAFPNDSPRAPTVTLGELTVERFVLLITEPLPPPLDLAEFSEAATDYMIESIAGSPVHGGSVPLHVLATISLSDDSTWLSALLDAHVYNGALGTRNFASVGPLESPSGTKILLCAVGPEHPQVDD